MTDTKSIFNPITMDIVSQIQKDSLSLHSTFWLNQNKANQVHAIMTTQYIALAEKTPKELKYLYYTPINFDLKFQVVHEGQTNNKDDPKSVFTKSIGFRLLKQGSQAVQLQIVSQSLLPVWLKYLGKLINQIGFHKLFKPQRKLGKGGFATVYEVERVTDGKLFAVKAFAKQATLNSKNQSHKLNLLNELTMMKSIDHPNLIRLEGIFESQNSLYVVLELLNQGHLHKQINDRGGKFTLGEVKILMLGLMKALKHLQDKNILHRDIKPENIMLRSGLEPVLADLGLATFANAEDYIFYRCGTPGYVSPQVTTLEKGKQISPVCDVFSMGVIFHILLTAKPLFGGKKFDEVYSNNKTMNFDLSQAVYNCLDGEAFDLLTKMLKVNANERITAEKALQHPFLNFEMEEEKQPAPSCTTLKNKLNTNKV